MARPGDSSPDHGYLFTALRGIQAGREYYSIMCPLKLVHKLFLFDEDEIPAKLRAQRVLNRTRIPEISRYVAHNPREYVFSSITASIDGDVSFEPLGEEGVSRNVGKLTVPMTASFLINDGQHRRAAIEEALKANPDLRDETISVVLFIDTGLKRSQQMFADLNKHAVRPTKSLGILYDHRDPLAGLARELSETVPTFQGMTETEKSTISNRSTKLFTLSSIYQATGALLGKSRSEEIEEAERDLAKDFWASIPEHIPQWKLASEHKVSAAELRRDYIHAHGVALHAIGLAGRALVRAYPKAWRSKLKGLRKLDWSRTNTALWEGRAMHGGKVSKANTSLQLTVNTLKGALGVKLSKEENRLEKRTKASRR